MINHKFIMAGNTVVNAKKLLGEFTIVHLD